MLCLKIYIIGSVASGKTTPGYRLSNLLGIEMFEMDKIVHNDILKTKRKEEEQIRIINSIFNKKDWIIEGTHRKNMDFVFKEAEKIVLLDISLSLRKRRILLRWIKQKFGIEKVGYEPNIDMLKNMYKWTKEFEESKSYLLKKLEKYNEKLIVFTNKDLKTIELNNIFKIS